MPPTDLNLTVISAGAGSGKTYALTGRMTALLQSGVRASGILATTFTQKSAAELQERVRVRLLEAGLTEAANDLGSALIGTVHSIGARLLQRFAFEAGVSPLVEIIADGDEQRLFNESLAQTLTAARIETMNRLADALGLTKKTMGDPYDWRSTIRQLTDVARANNFSREVLALSKARSWESFAQLLPPAQDTTIVQWNNRLLAHIDQTVAALEANEADQTKVTRDALETLRNAQNQLKWRGELYWHEWVKISKTTVGAKSKEVFEPLKAFVLTHDEHQQFQADVKSFIDTVFDIAMDALYEYEQYKKKRGLIDYTDMETYVSRLLRHEGVRATMQAELDLLLVDEFQDTSPIQLDIFLQMSRLARHSIWVGDPKQSIYGFRGAEPALMQAIIGATGGVQPENILTHSWRSRPDLVHAVNAIFTKSFAALPPEQVALQPAFDEPETARAAAPALIHWHFKSELDERKSPGQPWLENCIAAQIKVLLERGVSVYAKNRKSQRPAQPGDIAVLCRNNDECARMAESLHRAGLKAALSRAGLLATPEARLALACLKYLLSASDRLSAAEIQLISGHKTLEEVIDDRLQWLHRDNPAANFAPAASDTSDEPPSLLRQLNALRPRCADLSAAEILDAALDELDLRRIAAQLGNPAQRLDNLDRLRRYALDYESACNRLHSAASLSGFLLWLNHLADSDQDWQGSGESADAVRIVTYHRSKGLEYPIAICHSLDQSLREQVWGLNLVAESAEPDLDNILGNRWLRFWVNPYADQLGKTRLEGQLHDSEAWHKARRHALDEEARLLYVGLTRARDYLIFPTAMKGTRWLNRVFNSGDETIPTLDPHSDETPFIWKGEVLHAQTEVIYQPKDFPESTEREPPFYFHAPRKGKLASAPMPLFINPLTEMPSRREYVPGTPHAFANELEWKGEWSRELQHTLVAFLQADDPQLPYEMRLAAARHQLNTRQTAENLQPESLLRQSTALREWAQRQFAPVRAVAPYPFEAWRGQRFLRVEADLLFENDRTVALCRFAPFAEGMKKWEEVAKGQTPCAAWLSQLAERAFPGKTIGVWLIFGAEGQVVEVTGREL